MVRRVAYLAVGLVGMFAMLPGCTYSFVGGESRAAWRNAEERTCVLRRHVRTDQYIKRAGKVRDRGACGIDRALKVSAVTGGRVTVGPLATINCPMTAALESWITNGAQPAAMAWFGQPIVEIKQLGSYNCRRRNNESRARLSEHAFGNAIDLASFRLADGREVSVKRDWNGQLDARSFLRETFASACEQFKTVLGPGVRNHSDHFHLDLAHHNKAGMKRYCRPTPQAKPPRRQPVGRGLFSQAPSIDPVFTGSVPGAKPVATYARVPQWPPVGSSPTETASR